MVKGDHYQTNHGFIGDLRVDLISGMKISDGTKFMTSVPLKTIVYRHRELRKFLTSLIVDQ